MSDNNEQNNATEQNNAPEKNNAPDKDAAKDGQNNDPGNGQNANAGLTSPQGGQGSAEQNLNDLLERAFANPDDMQLQAMLANSLGGAQGGMTFAQSAFMAQPTHINANDYSDSRMNELIEKLKSQDEGELLAVLMELCQLLLMNNEDSLGGFPYRSAITPLGDLLKSPSVALNINLIQQVCKAIAYMMDSLPRSVTLFVPYIPQLLHLVSSANYIDVAEQAVNALEHFKANHSAQMLEKDGFNLCLKLTDFMFGTNKLKTLKIAAKCAGTSLPAPSSRSGQSTKVQEFGRFFEPSIMGLVNQLNCDDGKVLEVICECLSNIVERYKSDVETLKKLGEYNLLQKYQTLLVIQPSPVDSNHFVMVIKTMCQIITTCPQLSSQLVQNNITDTLQQLLCGSSDSTNILPRNPLQMNQITALIRELLPPLPSSYKLFEIDQLINGVKPANNNNKNIWQWQDNDEWVNYNPEHSQIIEQSRQSGSNSVVLTIHGQRYTVDFKQMTQTNNSSKFVRNVRKGANLTPKNNGNEARKITCKEDLNDDEVKNVEKLIISLYNLVFEIFSASAGSPGVRLNCLTTIKKMFYYGQIETLSEVLFNQKNLKDLSSNIKSMLSGSNLDAIVASLQISDLLMNRMPAQFEDSFQRQGVVYQIAKLLEADNKIVGENSTPAQPSTSSSDHDADLPPSFMSMMDFPATLDANDSFRDFIKMMGGGPSMFTKEKKSSKKAPVPMGRRKQKPSTKAKIPKDPSTDEVFNRNLVCKIKDPRKVRATSTAQIPKDPNQSSSKKSSSKKSTSSTSTASTSSSSKSAAATASKSSTSTSMASKAIPIVKKSSSRGKLKTSKSQQSTSAPSASTSGTSQKSAQASTSKSQASSSSKQSTSAGETDKSILHRFTKMSKSDQLHKKLMSMKKQFGFSSSSSNSNRANVVARHFETDRKVKKWIRDQSSEFLNNFFPSANPNKPQQDVASQQENDDVVMTSPLETSTLQKLTDVANKISNSQTLEELSASLASFRDLITSNRDASPFELHQSRVMTSLTRCLTDPAHVTPARVTSQSKVATRSRSVEKMEVDDVTNDKRVVTSQIEQHQRLRCFLNVFAGLPLEYLAKDRIEITELKDSEESLRHKLLGFVRKLTECVDQSEQLPVKHNDVLAVGNSQFHRSEVLGYLTTKQMTLQLKRHPDSPNIKQWGGHPVRVDPLSTMSVIEKYLLERNYHFTTTSSSAASQNDVIMSSDDDDDVSSDEPESEIEDTSDRSTTSSANSGEFKLQLYIGNNLISPKSTIYQSVKEYSKNGAFSKQSAESNQAFWSSAHTVLYKQIPVEKEKKKLKAANKQKTFSFATGKLKWQPTLINKYLQQNSNDNMDSSLKDDDSLETLNLLKVIYGLSKHWYMLYSPTSNINTSPLVSLEEFQVGKLAAKCQRQVQDPLMIVTGSVPSWVNDLASTYPFTLPFNTRTQIFRVLAMDRERAIHYLIDSGKMNELNNKNEQSSSVSTHRGDRFKNSKLEKKKFTVDRSQLLSEAMKIMQEHSHKKPLIEVEYLNESGTGKGPIQEFYTLVSKQLHRQDLEMWRCDNFEASSSSMKDSEVEVENADEHKYVHSQTGLFPNVENTKKNLDKFTFLGKLMAKSLMDNRLLDIQLSPIFYKWLLDAQCGICWQDFQQVDVDFSRTFNKLVQILHNNQMVHKSDISMEPSQKKRRYTKKQKKTCKVSDDLLIDGCEIKDLMLDFQITNSKGQPIEMCKNGKNINVSLDNLDKYINLLSYWTLHEGIKHQMEAVKSGFNSVLPLNKLNYFYPDELDYIMCGERYRKWKLEEISNSCVMGHGYTRNDESVQNLFKLLTTFNLKEQRDFLQFVTGCPTLPIGGLAALSPRLTIVRKTCDVEDSYLPSVMTCVNYLKLPNYSNMQVLTKQLKTAMREGQQAFLLS